MPTSLSLEYIAHDTSVALGENKTLGSAHPVQSPVPAGPSMALAALAALATLALALAPTVVVAPGPGSQALWAGVHQVCPQKASWRKHARGNEVGK